MKLKFLTAIIATFVLTGCEGGQAPSSGAAARTSSSAVYSKDPRTGLCFATIMSPSYPAYMVASMTNVPCTPEVERLLVK